MAMRLQFITVITLLSILKLVPASPVSAGDDTFIVPRAESGVTSAGGVTSPGEVIFEILDSLLLDNDTPGATIHEYTETVRGVLERTGPDRFTYTLNEDSEFWSAEIDHFRYVFDAQTGESAIVYLLADVSEPLYSSNLKFRIDPSPWTLTVLEGSVANGASSEQTGGEDPPGIVEEISLEATSDAAYLGVAGLVKPEPEPTCSISANVDLSNLGTLDSELTIAASAPQGEALVELVLSQEDGIDEDDIYMVRARAEQDEVGTLAVPLADDRPQNVAVSFWPASNPAANNAGLVLEIDGKIVASTSGFVGEGILSAEAFDVRIGAVNGPLSISDPIDFGEPTFRMAPERRLVLMPIFADGIETGDFVAWTTPVGNLYAALDAKIHGDWGIEVPAGSAPYLVDDSPKLESHYRSRFSFKLNTLSMANGDRTTLLKGLDPSGEAPFSVRIERRNGAFELCAEAHQTPPVPLECFVVTDETAAYSVEIQWWAGDEDTAEPDGGLKLWVRDLADFSEPWHSVVLDLANEGLTIDEARLGAIDPPASAQGTFYLDDFESWR